MYSFKNSVKLPFEEHHLGGGVVNYPGFSGEFLNSTENKLVGGSDYNAVSGYHGHYVNNMTKNWVAIGFPAGMARDQVKP